MKKKFARAKKWLWSVDVRWIGVKTKKFLKDCNFWRSRSGKTLRVSFIQLKAYDLSYKMIPITKQKVQPFSRKLEQDFFVVFHFLLFLLQCATNRNKKLINIFLKNPRGWLRWFFTLNSNLPVELFFLLENPEISAGQKSTYLTLRAKLVICENKWQKIWNCTRALKN